MGQDQYVQVVDGAELEQGGPIERAGPQFAEHFLPPGGPGSGEKGEPSIGAGGFNLSYPASAMSGPRDRPVASSPTGGAGGYRFARAAPLVNTGNRGLR